MKAIERLIPVLLIIVSLAFAGIFAYVATERTLTNLESVILQAFALGAGLIGSFVFGRQSAKEAAKEIIKPHARSAFRRLLSLYQSLSRVGSTIEESQKTDSIENHGITLAKLEAIVIEQLATADDALEDWRDIVPEDVEELRQRLITKEKAGEKQ